MCSLSGISKREVITKRKDGKRKKEEERRRTDREESREDGGEVGVFGAVLHKPLVHRC